MLIVDLIIAALVLAAAVWGYRQGLSGRALALLGFTAGAILGSRVAPLMLDAGYEDSFAPVVALPGALVVGAIVGAIFERLGFGLARRVRSSGPVNAIAGAVIAACLGLVTVWVLGAAAARIDDLRPDVRDSRIIERLNAALPPPGPVLNPEKRRLLDPLPQVTGPRPNIGPLDASITRAPQVRAAAGRVVKLRVSGCGRGGRGSGWIARDGVVVTNAHVVEKMATVHVQPRGRGPLFQGQVVWYDRPNDVALVRVPGLGGVPALPIGPEAHGGTRAAALGFPGGGRYRVEAARTAEPTRQPAFEIGGKSIRARVTPFRAVGIVPGSSGGPVIDRRGRVRAMTFAVQAGKDFGFGVPIAPINRGLRRGDGPVSTGSC